MISPNTKNSFFVDGESLSSIVCLHSHTDEYEYEKKDSHTLRVIRINVNHQFMLFVDLSHRHHQYYFCDLFLSEKKIDEY